MDRLKTSLFASMLAAAGIPIYIHLPQFASTEFGLSLSTIGVILIGIRILDFLQDPLLGWMVDRWPQVRPRFAALAAFGLAFGFMMLFTVTPPFRADFWLVMALVILFTAYSLATILIYGQSVEIAERNDGTTHVTIAAYREAGLVVGVIIAAIAPFVLAKAVGSFNSYRAFGLFLAAFAILAWAATRGLWTAQRKPAAQLTFKSLREAGSAYLLVLALANALPLALTSTLFLFFVEDRLALPGSAGLFLILFFVAAGLATPLWSWLVQRHGPKQVLIPAMLLSILGFMGAALLPQGAQTGFALICIVSGAALGADLVILPALFASTLSAAGFPTGQAFGIWAFISKMALALSALLALPYLELKGYSPGAVNTPDALRSLNFTYAVLPCLMKVVVIAMTFRLPSKGVQL